jgi:hypothetical protein
MDGDRCGYQRGAGSSRRDESERPEHGALRQPSERLPKSVNGYGLAVPCHILSMTIDL